MSKINTENFNVKDVFDKTLSVFVPNKKDKSIKDSSKSSSKNSQKMNLRKKGGFNLKDFAIKNESILYIAIITASLGIMGGSMYLESKLQKAHAIQAIAISKLQPLAFQLDTYAKRAAAGQQDSFVKMNNVNDVIVQTLKDLTVGSAAIPMANGVSLALAMDINKRILPLQKRIYVLNAGEHDLVSGNNLIEKINSEQEDFDTAIEELISMEKGRDQIALLKLSSQMKDGIRTILNLGTVKSMEETLAQLVAKLDEVNYFADFPASDERIAKLKDMYEVEVKSIRDLMSESASLNKAKNFMPQVEIASISLNKDLDSLLSSFDSKTYSKYLISSVLSLLLALFFSSILLYRYVKKQNRLTKEAADLNKENQDSILSLMDDLSIIADGDLTKKAMVNESITGAIADSVNYTIDELRSLVKLTVISSQKIKSSMDRTKSITEDLSTVANRQTTEIDNATGLVELVVRSIHDIESSANQSKQVAYKAIDATKRGSQAVHDTINGMNLIRDQIQDTSKRIKRLGESSQEIGDIVSLISNITEQTNVLALNAALQAVSAGEAGRGFAIVAEEVQRLAERSAEATKQIASLVRLIQNDTHDAVFAMEKSTTGVVEGARLSDVAGATLKEIETVSHELAELIASISVSTQSQSEMSKEVTIEMNNLKEVTQKSISGVKDAELAVKEVVDFTNELESSVLRFKV